MTARAVVTAWIAAAALLAATVAAMIIAAGPAPPLFHGAPVAAIGSSLMHNAMPQRLDGHGGILGDGRAHWRVGLAAITEDETTALLAHAIDEHAQVALVEANALLFDFARYRARGRCDQPAARLRHALKLLQRDITDVYARLLGKPGALDEDPTQPEFEQGALLPERLRGIYPLVLRGPCKITALEELAARARADGTVIVLVVPPRAQSAEKLLGPVQKQQIATHAQALAKRLGARLFLIADAWPDAEFLDGEHLNRAGRAHFLAVLRAWWPAQGRQARR